MLVRIILSLLFFLCSSSLFANEEWFLTAPSSREKGDTMTDLHMTLFYGSGISDEFGEYEMGCTLSSGYRLSIVPLLLQFQKYKSLSTLGEEKNLLPSQTRKYISEYYGEARYKATFGDCQRYLPTIQGVDYSLIDEASSQKKYSFFTSYSLSGSILDAPLVALDFSTSRSIRTQYISDFLSHSGFLASFPRNKQQANQYMYAFREYWHYNGTQKNITLLLFPESSHMRSIVNFTLQLSLPVGTQIDSVFMRSGSGVETPISTRNISTHLYNSIPDTTLQCLGSDPDTHQLINTSCSLHLTDVTPDMMQYLIIKTK